MVELISNREIYQRVILEMVPDATESVWIATADIKDMHVEGAGGFRPFLGVLADLVSRGVEIRLLHAKEPGPNFRKDFDQYPELLDGLERSICPRVHQKSIVVDRRLAYLGSANLTGAGMGAKSQDRRNFELGIISDESGIVTGVMELFDAIWMGAHCRTCRRRDFCPDPIA